MKWQHTLACGCAGLALSGGMLFADENVPANAVVAAPPVYKPDTSHQNDPLPDGVLTWDAMSKSVTVTADAGVANFSFSFTNVSPAQVAILDVHPSCGCTTAKVPPMPWIIPPRGDGQFGLTVNVAGRTGTLVKSVTVKTDKGLKQLLMQITIQPAVLPAQSEADRARAVALARADRQSILRGDCATCHVKPGEGKYGKPLYDADCGICHDSPNRASMVPDLHNLKNPTNLDFWQIWTAHGKAGSLMPAFASSDGGPLSDVQVSSIAQYLAGSIPPQPSGNK